MFTSLGTATKGLHAAQVGLSTTGHNLSNMNVYGYSRQQSIQMDTPYLNRGTTALGINQIGTGTDISKLRQIRDQFLDRQYRQEATKASFYNVKHDVGFEIETIIGELQSDYNTQSVIQDIWDSLNELSIDTGSIATRGTFVSNCVTFLEKFNVVYEDLKAEQYRLNDQVTDTVTGINNLVSEIQLYNEKITSAEMAGDSANDYRDARNVALDELSTLLPIVYTEEPNGYVGIMCEGNYLLSNGTQNNIGLRYTTGQYSFVEPVYTNSDSILPASNISSKRVLSMTGTVNAETGNDESVLRALLMSRGSEPITNMSVPKPPTKEEPIRPTEPLSVVAPTEPDPSAYTDGVLDPAYKADYEQYKKDYLEYNQYLFDYAEYEDELEQYNQDYDKYLLYQVNPEQFEEDFKQYEIDKFNIEEATIPKTLKDLDTVFNAVCTMINDALAPQVKDLDNAPYDLNGDQTYLEIFVRKEEPYSNRYDSNGAYINEDEDDYYSQYTMGNVMINPELMNVDGYDKIPLSLTGDINDNTLVLDLMDKWSSDYLTMPGSNNETSIEGGYNFLVSKLGNETSEAGNAYDAQVTNMVNLENQRTSISGVSLDEEMTNMMKYQHSYNAAARLLNIIDSMIDTVVNRTGRVGI